MVIQQQQQLKHNTKTKCISISTNVSALKPNPKRAVGTKRDLCSSCGQNNLFRLSDSDCLCETLLQFLNVAYDIYDCVCFNQSMSLVIYVCKSKVASCHLWYMMSETQRINAHWKIVCQFFYANKCYGRCVCVFAYVSIWMSLSECYACK